MIVKLVLKRKNEYIQIWSRYSLFKNTGCRLPASSSAALSEWLSLVTCKQRADHFTPMMWFDFIRWRFHLIRGRFHHSDCIKYNQIIFHLKLIIDTCTQHEIQKPQIYGLHRWLSMGWVGGQIVCLFWHLCIFFNKLLSVCCYETGPFSGWWRLGGNGLCYLTAPLWKCMLGIGDHRFTFFTALLPTYTFYTYLTILSIWYLLIEYVTSLIMFNIWKVEKSV